MLFLTSNSYKVYIQFRHYFEAYPLISLVEIKKRFPDFDRRRLVEWQQKGYIEKIRQGFYRFKNQSINEKDLYLYANKIYEPSYISLESALAYYQLIPEAVFRITSISTRNTTQFKANCCAFTYKHVKPNLFFGFRLVPHNGFNLRIACLEKAILDYLYLHPELKTIADFEGLRWNKEVLKSLDFQQFSNYLQVFNSKQLSKRVQLLQIYIDDKY